MNPIYRGQEPPKNTDVLWIKGKKILVYTDNGWEETSTDAFVIDSSMVPNSENPVQSKVIQNSLSQFQQSANQQLNLKQNVVTLDTSLSESSVNMIENKAVYDQYTNTRDIIDICRILNPDFGREWVDFHILEDGDITVRTVNSSNSVVTTFSITISYKKNNDTEWTDLEFGNGTGSVTLNVEEGDVIKFGGVNTYYGNSSYTHLNIKADVRCNVQGNIMALINKADYDDLVALSSSYTFVGLFEDSKIIDASQLLLPATTLQTYCYSRMFKGCTLLSAVPVLPALTLTSNCYESMFENSGITVAPALPSTSLASSCYYSMFKGSAVTAVPNLPATTVYSSSYGSMFQDCTGITTVPALSATTLASSCYYSMFQGCTSLVSATSLPATTAYSYCYDKMFKDCSSLVNAPTISLVYTSSSCCEDMFENCTSLVVAPILNSTYITYNCYGHMFRGCSSLTTPPALPATVLDKSCYGAMFKNCTSLETAPELPASFVENSAYSQLFMGCSSLKYVKCLATSFSGSATYQWMDGVYYTGTFVKKSGASWNSGSGGIPSNWTVESV